MEKDYEDFDEEVKTDLIHAGIWLKRYKEGKITPENITDMIEKSKKVKTKRFENRPKTIKELMPTIMENIKKYQGKAEDLSESAIENYMSDALRNTGLGNYKAQHQIGTKRVDFAFPEKKLVVECDGFNYHTSKEQIEKDYERDRYLEKRGWIVLHFSGIEIRRKIYDCIEKIKFVLN